MQPKTIFTLVAAGISAIAIFGTILSSTYIIDEGKVGVVTRMGQAVRQENPQGLQFKMPFIEDVKEFDVRERVLSLQVNATTSNQLSSVLLITVNWQPDRTQILDIFKKYGSPEQFANNVVLPRANQAAKAAIGQFSSVSLTTERNTVADKVLTEIVDALNNYPALFSSAQIEDYTLPERYWAAILDKEEQREKTQKENLLLQQQKIQAQQKVQTAEAERDATKARADGNAYAVKTTAEAEAESIRLRAEAEADGIRNVREALADNPLLIEYERVKNWNGQLPTTVLGDDPQMLMQLSTNEQQ